MTFVEGFACAGLVLAGVPTLVFLNNLQIFRRPDMKPGRQRMPISVVIPARNESSNIDGVIQSVRASEGVEFEVIVVDDHSEDDTASRVEAIRKIDERIKLVSAPAMPGGWCGKQFACHTGSIAARFDRILFLDADVRVSPEALACFSDAMEDTGFDLVSGFPRQITRTWLEILLIPLIHFVLLGFLPLARMRRSTHPSYAAGCGQMILVRRSAYEASGGHDAIKASLMDGIALPRAFRRNGFSTDVIDATALAECRMYHNARAVWSGLAKNATEGLASWSRIGPATLLFMVGHVAPFVLVLGASFISDLAFVVALTAVGMALLARLVAGVRFRQPLLAILFHPVAITLLLAIQWYALFRRTLGGTSSWRGREYVAP